MSTVDSPALGEDHRRIQWIYWPTLLGAALLAAIVPWYFGVAGDDLRPALRVLLVGGVAAVVLMQLQLGARGFLFCAIGHALGVVLLAAAWYALGTFDVAGFLILFALPVFAAALVSDGWFAYFVAGGAIASTTAAALFSSPILRWYIEQLPIYPQWLPELETTRMDSLGIAASLDGHEQLVALVTFGIAILSVALLGTAATRMLDRLESRLRIATRTHRERKALATMLLEETQTLEAFVSPSAGRILSTNAAFERSLDPSMGPGGSVFEALSPVYPETLMQLIGSPDGGKAVAQICRLNGRHRVFDIAAQPLEIDSQPAMRLRICETPSSDLAVSALEHFGFAMLILGPDHRVLFNNPAFLAVFPRADLDASADKGLDDCHGLPSRWWDIAPSRRSLLRFEVSGRRFVAAVALAAVQADRALTLIHLQAEGEP